MSDNTQAAQKKNVKVHISPEMQKGAYANLASVTVGKNEMIFDFAFLMPNGERADVVSRVVVSPQVGKNFASALQNAMLDFEKKQA